MPLACDMLTSTRQDKKELVMREFCYWFLQVILKKVPLSLLIVSRCGKMDQPLRSPISLHEYVYRYYKMHHGSNFTL
jgi:hypothetical protein